MKKLLTGLCAIALCFGLVLPVRLQAAQVPDAVANAKDVDYDVTVASNDNELNLRVGPGAEYPLAYATPHHNEDVLHIYKETTAASGNPWGFTLGGPNRDVPGWIALIPTNRAGAAPAPLAAAPAAPSQASGGQTSSQPAAYSGSGTAADYDVMVNSADGELNLRTGPGAEYPLAYST
ncbi:MAG: hypothetical protein J6I56_10285, partial [Lachnospiraceae bacterium]|nr:hypothetical protein [Lachnospiraceae bacterium]